MTDRELMQQALEALEAGPDVDPIVAGETADALRERLAQPEPPPECKTEEEKLAFAFGYWKAVEAQRVAQPQRTHWEGCEEVHPECRQPRREWVGLTDEEADELVERFARYELLHAIEAKLREKNNG